MIHSLEGFFRFAIPDFDIPNFPIAEIFFLYKVIYEVVSHLSGIADIVKLLSIVERPEFDKSILSYSGPDFHH